MTDKLARISKKTAADAFAELAKEIPGAGAALAVAAGVLRRRNEVKFQTFLEEICKPLAFDNWETAAGYILKNIEEPWMADGLDEGWRTLQDTLDPIAKRCVYLMVADYLHQKRHPDRLYKQLAIFLQFADQPARRAERSRRTGQVRVRKAQVRRGNPPAPHVEDAARVPRAVP